MFAYLVAGRYGTPFVVASKIGLGGLVFLVGRFAVVAMHELAHGLTMASYGRRIEQRRAEAGAGVPVRVRRHVGGVVRAAPAADRDQRGGAGVATSRSGRCSRSAACCWRAGAGARHLLPARVRGLHRGVLQPQPVPRPRRLPHPRRRPARAGAAAAGARAVRAAAGRAPGDGDSRVLARYSLFGLVWSCVAGLFVVAMTLRYRATLEAVAPAGWIVWTVMAAVWVAVFVPVLVAVGRPLAQRTLSLRRGGA